MDPLYTAAQTAEWLGTSVGTLAAWRYEGRGPAFVKVGRNVRYRETDVKAWLAEQTRTSTAPTNA